MSTESPDFFYELPPAACPGCGERQGWLAPAGVETWWCSECLRRPITEMLDRLAEISPQRPSLRGRDIEDVKPL